jgi:hypothetical protein
MINGIRSAPTWSFFVIAALGLWLITSPAAFNFQSKYLVLSDMVCGSALIILPLWCRKRPKQWMLWLIAFIGIWIQFAPLLYWAPTAAAYLTNVLIGCLVITFSVILFPLPGELANTEPTIPPGWSYNPSSGPQRLPIAVLVFFCWTISRYLAAYQLGYIDTIWDPFFVPGTKAVIESAISKSFPVSDAGMGALAYTIEFFSTCQGGKARWRTAPWLVLIFGILVIPVGLISMTLIILQPVAVGTWCTLCLATAACMLIAVPFAIDEVIASLQFLKRTGWRNLFRGGECPGAMVDEKTPSMNHSLFEIAKAGSWGVGLPWNLALLVPLGIFLMATPAIFHVEGLLFDMDPILGAFTVAASVVSLAVRLRKLRLIVLLFAATLLIIAVSTSELFTIHTPIALLMGLLCLRKG